MTDVFQMAHPRWTVGCHTCSCISNKSIAEIAAPRCMTAGMCSRGVIRGTWGTYASLLDLHRLDGQAHQCP
jgi:hypothetical protein